MKNVHRKENGSVNSIAFLLVMIFAVMLIFIVSIKFQIVYAAKHDILNALESSSYGALINEKEITYESIYDLADNGYEAVRYASLAADADKAYNTFKSALENNLCGISGYNAGNVIDDMKISEFIVYNVTASTDSGIMHRDVNEYRYNSTGLVSHRTYRGAADDGSIVTPTGKTVTETCVYSRVDYTVRIYKQQKFNACLDLTCSIRRDSGGEHDIN